jgi:hypothetical protein
MPAMLVTHEYMLQPGSTLSCWQSNNADVAVFIGFLWVT